MRTVFFPLLCTFLQCFNFVKEQENRMNCMASKLQTKAAQVSQFVTKNGSSYYKELMERNNQYIQKPSSAHTCQLLAKQLFYTRLASIPRRYEALWKELDSLKQFLKTKDAWSMENASVAALFGVECYAWSWGGEIIGRGFTLTGYYV
ncbi:ATP synthase [Theobroma cacao]|nr:ATP synthase [Theobroma cacao]